jgi:signal transduction histidine kinase
VLRILNDGEPFDAEKTLGPETGHFGLFGMFERARRSGFGLSFVRHGKWCGVRIAL